MVNLVDSHLVIAVKSYKINTILCVKSYHINKNPLGRQCVKISDSDNR